MKRRSHYKERFHSFIRLYLLSPLGFLLYLSALIFFMLKRSSSATKVLLTSIRYSYSSLAISHLSTRIHREDIDFSRLLSRSADANDAEGRAIILSPPRRSADGIEKGVILLSFSHTFSYFLNHNSWNKLDELFVFVLEPSWAGYADPDILHFIQKAGHCVVQASEVLDRALINSLFPSTPCLDIGASNWVDEAVFLENSGDTSKQYDAIYIANLNPIKRAYRAIDAFSDAAKIDPHYKAIIVCASWGENSTSELQAYVKSKHMADNITITAGMSQGDLISLLHRCKCSILLSLKEGSNRVLFESMFVGVPVICLSENIGVNKSYINESTGLLVSDRTLTNALITMSSEYSLYRPRAWALTNISPRVTTNRLKDLLSTKYGSGVNNELLVKVNAPEVRYQNLSDQKELVNNRLFGLLPSGEIGEIIDGINECFPPRYSTLNSNHNLVRDT